MSSDGGQLLQGPGLRRWPRTPAQLVAVDVIIVILVGLVGLYLPPLEPTKYDSTLVHSLAYGSWIAASIAFLFHRRHPRGVLSLLLVLFLVGMCVRSPAPASNYLGFAVYSVVVTSERRCALLATLGTLVVTVVGLVIGGGPLESGAIVSAMANLFLGWVAGEYVRTARSYAALRAQVVAGEAAAAEASRADQVSRAVADERAKLARELHDVVAHGMSLIAVRAGVGRMVIDTKPEQAGDALAIIETTSRRTLQEMRLLVGVLRGDRDQEADREPAPGLQNLPGLITDTELTGLNIDLAVRGQRRPLDPAVDLSAYRIVQEALTNASRHAGPTTAHVTLDYRSDSIAIEVQDDGPRPGFTPDPSLHRRSAGHGLIGIRERAALFSGTSTTGPLGPGYQVIVILKTPETYEDSIADPQQASCVPVGPTA